MHYGYYANGFQFDSHFADLYFLSLLFFRLMCYLYGLVLT